MPSLDHLRTAMVSVLSRSSSQTMVSSFQALSKQPSTSSPLLQTLTPFTVKSVVLFGDPTHSAPQNFVKGSGFNNGMIPRYADLTGGQFAGRIASWCNSGDPICDSGSDMNQHLTYMDVYKESAAYFTLANLAQ